MGTLWAAYRTCDRPSHPAHPGAYVDFILGVLSPGAAFGRDADAAYFTQLLITYEFW